MSLAKYTIYSDLHPSASVSWTYTKLSISLAEYARNSPAKWCADNVDNSWTMLAYNHYGFSNVADATAFSMMFSGYRGSDVNA